MIKVSVFYPKAAALRFDMPYYLGTHMPMVRSRLGAACLKTRIDQGLSGGAPGSEPPFAVICHLYFDTLQSFQTSFGPHAGEITADIDNYTDAKPVIQISDVVE